MILFIKNLGLILCCIFCFIKLLHLTTPKHSLIQYSIFSVLLSLFSVFSELYTPYHTIPFQVTCLCVFLLRYFRLSSNTYIPAILIAFALSGIGLFLSSLITGTIFIQIKNYNHPVLIQLFSFFLQIFIMISLFRIKRLKKGMPFLHKDNYSYSGIVIGFLAMIMIMAITYIKENNILSLFATSILLFIIFTFLVYEYWKKNLKNIYLDKLEERDRTQLEQMLSQQEIKISELKSEILRLQKIIHDDNRRFPELAQTLRNYLERIENQKSDEAIYGKELLENIYTISNNRKESLQIQEAHCRQNISTKVFLIDMLISYMQELALEKHINLQINLSCDLPYLTEFIITENDLHTLLTCLLDNAIIATKCNNGNYILLAMAIIDDCYTISIFDSGISFSVDVLKNWGIECITTHADNNGSGIGMMSIYEILKKYKASFLVHEFTTNQHAFTKEIRISFDQKNQYNLCTNRPEKELIALRERTDLHIYQG